MTQVLTSASGVTRMKKVALAPILVITWLHLFAPPLSTAALAAGTCPASGISSSSGAIDLTANCQVVGAITLSGTASLTMTGAVLTVQGNIVLNDQALLTVTNGGLTFPQTRFGQYAVYLSNSAHLTMNNSTLVTNGTLQNSFSMVLEAKNTSVVDFEGSTLSWQGGSWLLGNFHDQSQLTVNNSESLPTEIYPFDSSRISVSRSNFATVWLEFNSGSSGTINVPQYNKQRNFNFNFGKSPGFNYSVNLKSSSSRLGLNSHPNSRMTVNGSGSANDVNVEFGYFVEDNTAPVAVTGLPVSKVITTQYTDQGRTLSLNNVNLNPFSWQVEVSRSNGFPVSVSNSIINEIRAGRNGLVNISNSTLQLAVAGAVGPGSKMNITGTQIWSHSILALNGGQMSITNSHIHGNVILAVGPGSSITMTDSTEDRNGSAGMSCAPVNGFPLNTNGVPLCNPLNPLGQCSQVSTQSGGTVTGVPACT